MAVRYNRDKLHTNIGEGLVRLYVISECTL